MPASPTPSPPGSAEVGRGRVVVLNGATSSGKSTLARALVETLSGVWFHLAVDDFHAARGRREWTDAEFASVFRRTLRGFHRAVAGLASAGNDVVVDLVLSEQWRLDDLVATLDGFPVLFVGLHCSPDELERRERVRADRVPGSARAQHALVHRHGRYDLELDTERDTVPACVAAVEERLRTPDAWTAFARLRRR